jgi:SAM-dependent methyltransferase
MESVRSRAPIWVKRLVWDRKHTGAQTNPSGSPLVDFLAPRIPQAASLLDLGCATGNLLAGLRRNGWNGHYTGVDISPRAISVARKINDARAEWLVSPIEDFAIDREFDLICFVESLYYVRLERVQEVLRRCREHGKAVYVRIWNGKEHAPFIRQLGACENPRPDVFVLRN